LGVLQDTRRAFVRDRTERRAGRLDTVPLDAPAETKQTVVNSWGPAEYRGFEHHDVHS
jgi:hypothetical protein